MILGEAICCADQEMYAVDLIAEVGGSIVLDFILILRLGKGMCAVFIQHCLGSQRKEFSLLAFYLVAQMQRPNQVR